MSSPGQPLPHATIKDLDDYPGPTPTIPPGLQAWRKSAATCTNTTGVRPGRPLLELRSLNRPFTWRGLEQLFVDLAAEPGTLPGTHGPADGIAVA